MRIFTENDKQALGAALKTFYGYMNGTNVRTAVCTAQAEKALAAGLTIDEILNRENYARVAEEKKPTLEEYIDALIERAILVRPLKDEADWADPGGFILYAEIFHDFYQRINGTGGTYTTATAKANLAKAINRNGLQPILSDKLIGEVMDKSGKGEKLTCFNYIEHLLLDAESYDIDNSLSEEQFRRDAISQEEQNPVIPDDPSFAETAEAEPREKDGDPAVTTEGSETDNDGSLYPDWEDPEPGEQSSAYLAALNPREFKRNCVAELIYTLTLQEIAEMARFVKTKSDDITLEEFINALAEGRIDKHAESANARTTHIYLNENLYTSFLECLALQGVSISEETATKMDYLSESWDMRSEKTRKMQKMKELIYQHAFDDEDLLSVINDLEDYYDNN